MMTRIRIDGKPMWMVALLFAVAAVNAQGKPGEGIQACGDMVVRPFVDASISYDSNPLLLSKEQEVDDFFLDVSPGLNVTRAGEFLRLEGLFRGRFRRFDELTSEDKDDWSEELRLGLGHRDDWRLQLRERFGRVSDYDLFVRTMDAAAEGTGDRYMERSVAPPLSVMERSERVDRDLLDCGLGFGGPLTEKMSLDAAFDYGNIDYVTDNLLDSTEAKASVKVARKVSDKSSAILVGEYIQMENDSVANPADYYAARAGWRWQGTFKSRFEGTIGYCGLTDVDPSSSESLDLNADDPSSSESLDEDGVSYDLSWYWQAWPKLSMTLGGRSGMQLSASSPGNAKRVDMVSAGVHYDASTRLAFTALLGYRNEDNNREQIVDDSPVTPTVEQLHGRIRCDYQLLKWLKGYGAVWMEDTTDNVRGDYTETRATLGVRAEY